MTQPAARVADHAPYCQHAECHDPRTRVYVDGGATGTSQTDWSLVKFPKLTFPGPASSIPGSRRWCWIHALMFEGWA